jgi:hypothetical protein
MTEDDNNDDGSNADDNEYDGNKLSYQKLSVSVFKQVNLKAGDVFKCMTDFSSHGLTLFVSYDM